MRLLKQITGAMILLAMTASAQEASNISSRKPSFGVKGGVNFATVTGDDFDSPDSRTSFHVGVVGELPIADIFSLQVEALYSGQGFKSNIDGGVAGGDGKIEYQLDYINVPVLAKLYATKGLSFEVGPQFSFKVNEEIDTNPTGNSGDIETDEVRNFDFGVAAGLTIQTDMGLFATGRYTYGLTDIIKDSDVNHSVFQIGIGYKF